MNKSKLITILADQREQIISHRFEDLVTRREEGQVEIESPLAQVVIGVRRSGKSTLCEKVIRSTEKAFAYVNFDDDRLGSITTADLDDILDALYQLNGAFTHLFLDEVQNIEGWPLFVNRLLRQGLHLIVTGSNSKLLSSELMTHLTGRHAKIELYPFSFAEYATAAGVDLHSLSTRAIALRKRALTEYLMTGGLPELRNIANKRGYTEGLLHSIIHNDIARRFRVRHAEVMRQMAVYLMDNFCHEVVATMLGATFGMSDHTVENYYSYLKEAFLLIGVKRFSFKSRERLRGEKAYVVDLAFVTHREGVVSTENLGWRLENTICIELLRRIRPTYGDLFYYKERQYEVDFIVVHAGRVTQVIQVSYDISAPKTRAREVRALVRAAETLHCESLTLITAEEEGEEIVGAHTIAIVPAWKWLIGNDDYVIRQSSVKS